MPNLNDLYLARSEQMEKAAGIQQAWGAVKGVIPNAVNRLRTSTQKAFPNAYRTATNMFPTLKGKVAPTAGRFAVREGMGAGSGLAVDQMTGGGHPFAAMATGMLGAGITYPVGNRIAQNVVGKAPVLNKLVGGAAPIAHTAKAAVGANKIKGFGGRLVDALRAPVSDMTGGQRVADAVKSQARVIAKAPIKDAAGNITQKGVRGKPAVKGSPTNISTPASLVGDATVAALPVAGVGASKVIENRPVSWRAPVSQETTSTRVQNAQSRAAIR